jgi:hypothetical protein
MEVDMGLEIIKVEEDVLLLEKLGKEAIENKKVI